MKINSINPNIYHTNNTTRRVNSTPAFGAADGQQALGSVSKVLAKKVFPAIANFKPFQMFVAQLSKIDKNFTVLMITDSIILSSFYMINTAKNKKIKKEQKPQMLINDLLTLGVSASGSIFLDGKINEMVAKGTEKYIANRKDFYRNLAVKNGIKTPFESIMTQVGETVKKSGEELKQGAQNITETVGESLRGLVGEKTFQIKKEDLETVQSTVKEAITKAPDTAKEVVNGQLKNLYADLAGRIEADKFAAGMQKVKTLVIFGIIYRYLGPVVVTPLANNLSSRLLAKKNKQAEKAASK